MVQDGTYEGRNDDKHDIHNVGDDIDVPEIRVWLPINAAPLSAQLVERYHIRGKQFVQERSGFANIKTLSVDSLDIIPASRMRLS